MQYVEHTFASLDWATLLFTGSLLCLAIAKYSYPRRFEDLILLPLNNKYFLVHDKKEEIYHPFNILLFLPQIICVSLFVYLLFTVYNPPITRNSWLFVQICTGYVVFIMIKFSIEKIIGNMYSIDAIVNQYLYKKLSYRNVMALGLGIVDLIFFYMLSPTELSMAICLLLLIFSNVIALYAIYKKMGVLITGHFSYFILYLCALEIAPYIILYFILIGS